MVFLLLRLAYLKSTRSNMQFAFSKKPRTFNFKGYIINIYLGQKNMFCSNAINISLVRKSIFKCGGPLFFLEEHVLIFAHHLNSNCMNHKKSNSNHYCLHYIKVNSIKLFGYILDIFQSTRLAF